MNLKTYILIAAACACISAGAQTGGGTDRYQQAAGARSALFRGRQSTTYPFTYKGTYFLTGDSYSTGDLYYNGLLYTNVLLNLDAYGRQLSVRHSEQAPAVDLNRNLIKWFRMDGTTFYNLKAYGLDAAPEGFFEIYKDSEGTIVFAQRQKLLQTNNYTAEEIKNEFIPRTEYYKLKKGRFASSNSSRRDTLTPATIEDVDIPVTSASSEVKLAASSVPASRPAVSDLPARFFDSGKNHLVDNTELEKYLEAQNAVATQENRVYEIGNKNKARKGKSTLSGYVRDMNSGEPLVGVFVGTENGSYHGLTDNYGYYKINVPAGESAIRFSGYSLEERTFNVMVYSDGKLDVEMKEEVTALNAATVSADAITVHRDAKMGLERIRIETIDKVPVAFGEADVIKVVLTLPGVKSTGEASVGFNVRGSAADQNLILFNDGTIYNPSHMFGMFSAFNSDVVSDVQLYKSSIPAEYGGRIASVMDIKTKDGNSKKLTGSVGIGLLTSRLHLEGPIKKDKTTFILGARTTYSNWMLDLLPKKSSDYAGGRAQFHDVNLGISHKFNNRNSLHAYGYYSGDGFTFSGDTTFRYANLNASLKWRSELTDKTTMTMTAGYDQYGNELEDKGASYSAYNLETGIRQGFLKTGFKTVLNEKHTLQYGLNAVYYNLNPGKMTPLIIGGDIGNMEIISKYARALPVQEGVEPAIYLSDTWSVSNSLMVEGGIRYAGFKPIGTDKFYNAPEFRLSGKYTIVDNLSLKAGFNSMRQYIHLITNTASISPMDTWTLCTDRIKPQEGWQAASGLYWSIPDKSIDLSVEGYYKEMSNYLDYRSGATLVMNPNLADDIVLTRGRSYGVELMAKKSSGKLNGWMSYTYSRSFLKEMYDRGIETINHGDWYNAPQDMPHEFKLVGNYKFTHRYSFSLNVDYSTGKPVTIPVGTYTYRNGVKYAYSERNGYRIPDYFRMDLAFNIEPGHYLKAFTHMKLTFGVYNVTGRKNPYSVYFTTNGKSISGRMLSIFATQIPYVNIDLNF